MGLPSKECSLSGCHQAIVECTKGWDQPLCQPHHSEFGHPLYEPDWRALEAVFKHQRFPKLFDYHRVRTS